MEQNTEAQVAAFDFSLTQAIELSEMLDKLTRTYLENECQTIWCKGVQFDIGNLEFYYDGFNKIYPWTFRDRMDVRPYVGLLTEKSTDTIYAKYNLHDPIEDCKCQIEMVQHVYEIFNLDTVILQ